MCLLNSAAVIGRQLRQQQNTSRTSGPLVPPVSIYKGRPRTPSQIGRPYSPAATSSTFGTGTGHTSSTGGVAAGGVSVLNYSTHPQSTQSTSDQVSKHNYSSYPNSRSKPCDPRNSSNNNQPGDEEPRIRCTCHCFCIALKALSLGLCLLIAGVVMSGFGFYNEHYFLLQHTNLTVITETEKASLTMYRNLTYAGPVIMGLGGIMVVAALVLTFEVRDTLGVKVAPVKQQKQQQQQQQQRLNLSSIGQSASSQVPSGMQLQSFTGAGRKNTITSVSSTVALVPLVHLTPLKSNCASESSVTGVGDAHATDPSKSNVTSASNQVHQRMKETTLTEECDEDAAGEGTSAATRPSACQVRTCNNLFSSINYYSELEKSAVNDENYNIFTTSSSSETNSLANMTLGDTNDIGYMDYISSPQDTVISDPEGCSIIINTQGTSTPASRVIASTAATATSCSSLASSSLDSTHNPQALDVTYDKVLNAKYSTSGASSSTTGNKWRSARCSCSASPSHSMDAVDTLDLIFLTENTKQQISEQLYEEHLIQQRLLLQEQLLLEQQKQQLKLQERILWSKKLQMYRQPPRSIAFIESDGLSSTSTSSENLFTRKIKCKSAPVRTNRPSSSSTAAAGGGACASATSASNTCINVDDLSDDSLRVPLLDPVQKDESINESGKLFPLLQKQPVGY